uniref:RNA-directed DNA polymerase homolog n=1 Tax=Nicotiana tabacum TaxID=4097 RepID=A0A1S3YTQ8_TOBAC|nr:PREDICTED: uncharacterized protein LOC107779454 [Nicotiana tabacum]
MIFIVEVDEQLIDTSVYLDDSLEKTLRLFDIFEIDDEVEEIMHILDASCVYIQGLNTFEPLNRPSGPLRKPSIEEAPKLELNPLPPHLQYAYLGGSDTLPIIVSSDLSKLQEEKLLRVLREHKREVFKWLDALLGWCKETHLVLNWKKYHFMVREGIVLGHKISKNGLRVDKAKVEATEKLPPPKSIKGIRSFLGHAVFYRCFNNDFLNISSPLCMLLEKDINSNLMMLV